MEHKFSIYFEGLSNNLSGKNLGDQVEICDFELTNRLSDVLRLKTDEHFILFDEKQRNVFAFILGSHNTY